MFERLAFTSDTTLLFACLARRDRRDGVRGQLQDVVATVKEVRSRPKAPGDVVAAARNHLLEAAMLKAGLSADDVARELEVDSRTVRHWIAGRRPYPRLQGRLGRLLETDPSALWPRKVGTAGGTDELVAIYTHRADSPPALWRDRLEAAQTQIDLLGYAILFLFEMHAGLVEVLTRKGASGCAVRIAVVDPASRQAQERDAEEQLDEGLVARIRTALRYLSPLVGASGVEVRQHRTPMYNSVFRFDEQMLVTPLCTGPPGIGHRCSICAGWALAAPSTDSPGTSIGSGKPARRSRGPDGTSRVPP